MIGEMRLPTSPAKVNPTALDRREVGLVATIILKLLGYIKPLPAPAINLPIKNRLKDFFADIIRTALVNANG